MSSRIIRQKIARLASGNRPRVLDLFAGCGGISLGFHSAGFEITAAIELDPDAAKSHGINFHNSHPLHSKSRDITKIKPQQLADELDLGPISQAFDVIVGGPPCQAFARVGRSKLREIADHPEAFRHDERARLYCEYLEYVKASLPLVVLMENVPDMLNHGGHNIAEEVCETLSERGYVCGYTLLNSAYYGVPQMRERMFLIAVREELSGKVHFPKPTHLVNLPAGYGGSRAVALKLLEHSRLSEVPVSYIDPPDLGLCFKKAVTAYEALHDLPKIMARELLEKKELKRGTRRFDAPIPYPRTSKISDYAKLMREWPGFEAGDVIFDHVIRYLPRDYDLFARMNPGDQYPEAYKHAVEMFDEKIKLLEKSGKVIRKNSAAWKQLWKETVPPYDVGKFPNKWRKMERDFPARTLMAHLGKDSYSHIHYDSNQARTISVREAARLQSFPDGFVFSGTMNPAFRQIGNAVPPLMAKAIAEEIKKIMSTALERREESASVIAV